MVRPPIPGAQTTSFRGLLIQANRREETIARLEGTAAWAELSADEQAALIELAGDAGSSFEVKVALTLSSSMFTGASLEAQTGILRSILGWAQTQMERSKALGVPFDLVGPPEADPLELLNTLMEMPIWQRMDRALQDRIVFRLVAPDVNAAHTASLLQRAISEPLFSFMSEEAQLSSLTRALESPPPGTAELTPEEMVEVLQGLQGLPLAQRG